ncbi:odorant receptor 42b-like [Leptopilina boulardi]|uniref:odorant receptor 42b-like n=1 Tax=Leptopilina boulardi TaxID=63433 RepID=UPI0021F56CDA|nr:odorant receptor 42b-like [Leptopilina boulardi]
MNVVFLKMQSDWKTLTSKHDTYILHKYGKRCKLYNIVYIVGFFGSVTVYLFSRTILLLIGFFRDSSAPRPIIFLLDLGIDPEKYYYLILIYSHVCSYITTTLNVNGAMVFSMLLEHACGIFEIIGHKLTTALEERREYNNKLSLKENIHREIILCVKMHKRVLLFVNDIENFLSTAYFLIFGFCIIDLSITGVQFVMFINNASEALRFGFYAITQIFHIFLLTLPTQHLLDTSLCISSCIYSANWYQLSSKNKKSLLIIMRKGAEPTKFVVGGMFTLSLQFFTKVLQTSMSYFTVLMTVRR